MESRSSPGKALVVSEPPTTVQPLGSLCGFSSHHQTRHAPTWPARGLITVPPGGSGSHCPGSPTKPPPQPCRGLHPPRPGRPGPASPHRRPTLFPGVPPPQEDPQTDGLACRDIPPHRRPGQSRPGQGGRRGPRGPRRDPDIGPALRSLSQTPPRGRAAHRPSTPWGQLPPDAARPQDGDTSPTPWDQRAAPGSRSKARGARETCSLQDAHTPPPGAHALERPLYPYPRKIGRCLFSR